MPALSLEIRVDPRNWVSGVKFPAVEIVHKCFVVFPISQKVQYIKLHVWMNEI